MILFSDHCLTWQQVDKIKFSYSNMHPFGYITPPLSFHPQHENLGGI